MSKSMKPIDLRKLATNFATEKSKEDRYWQKNDAKFRAVHQRCANYDEFRQIVEAAHLRPLDRNETLTLERRPIAWNQPAANNSNSPFDAVTPSLLNTNRPTSFTTPRNTTEFIQQWRRIPQDMKLDYLRELNSLEHMFQTDIPIDLLHDLALLCQSTCTYRDAEIIVNVLVSLTQSKRFELVKGFLNENDKIELDRLFARLCSFAKFRFSIFLLRIVYF